MSTLVGQTQTIGFGLSFRPFVLVFLLPGEIICEPGLWLIFPRQSYYTILWPSHRFSLTSKSVTTEKSEI